jgi:uncharacterized membrane protein
MVTNDGRFESGGVSVNEPVNQSLSFRKIEPLLIYMKEIKEEIDILYEKRYWFFCPQVILAIFFAAISFFSFEAFSNGIHSFYDIVCCILVMLFLIIIVFLFFDIGSYQRETRRRIRFKSLGSNSTVDRIRKEQNSINSDLSDSETEKIDNWIRFYTVGVLNPSCLFGQLIETLTTLLKLGVGKSKPK